MSWTRILSATALAAALMVSAADAQQPTSQASTVMQDFGLTGKWAVDCSQPPSGNNPHVSFTVREGQTRRTTDAGPSLRQGSVVIVDAKRLDRSTIVVREQSDSPGVPTVDITIIRDDGRTRSLASQRVDDGSFLVKDGIVIASGRETPWLSRCAASTSKLVG